MSTGRNTNGRNIMSHRIEKTDGLVLVGAPAWHGLGTVVERNTLGIREGFRRAVPWEPTLVPLEWGMADVVPDARGVVAETPNPLGPQYLPARRFLATVGADYKLVTHDDVLSLAEAVEGADPAVRLETVGTTHGGRKLFLLLRVGQYGVGLNRADETSTYLALLNSFDGSTAFRGFGTEVRVVCANTYASALGAADGSAVGFRILHSGNDVARRIDAARAALAAGKLQLATLETENRALADHGLTSRAIGEYFARVASVLFPAVATERPADAKEAAAWERQRERARATVSEWVTELEHERQALVPGTAYAAFESVTHWADHGRPRVQESAADRLLGRGAQVKRVARRLALELVGG
jgi:phage/plasmid-like protein (TIGR03299 family)